MRTDNQISGRIYGILTNSVSGAVALLLFFLFLPTEVIDIEQVPIYLIDNDLVTAPVLFIFVVISYIVGQMMQAYTNFIPFRRAISRPLYFFPHIPRFEKEMVGESYRERFSWTCDKLFYRYEGIERRFPSLDVKDEDIDMAQSYLKNKNVSEVQIYEDISSSFDQLEVLFITSLIISLFILHPKNISQPNEDITITLIPLVLFTSCIISYILHKIWYWRAQNIQESRPDSEAIKRSKRINTGLMFKYLFILLMLAGVSSLILLMIPVDIEYTSNLEAISGSFFKYTPLLFLVLIYSSAYVEAKYTTMRKILIISDLYTVAISEGDIRDVEQD